MSTNFIDLENEYKERIIKIWDDFGSIEVLKDPHFEYRRFPLLPKEINTNTLLFVGMNPSFGKNGSIPEYEKPIGFYSKVIENSNEDIAYFKKFKEIAKYCNSDWSHLDLFFIRETNQKVVEEMCNNNIDFLNAQLEITFEIIEKVQPRLIVVANAFASEFFGKMKDKHYAFSKIWRGFEFFFEDDEQRNKKSTFDPKIGTYRIKFENYEVPIIFTGMLSGQRALDIGSYERLKWQIKMILDGNAVV